MTLKLFDDDSDPEERGEDLSINKEYARRFEHNKKREDLHRLEELKKKGLASDDNDDSEDSSDDDLAEELSKDDGKFFETIIKVRRKDPVIYSKDADLYTSEDEDDDGDGEADGSEGGHKKKPKKRKEKPLHIKDVNAMHLLEDGPELEEKPSSKLRESLSKLYDEEQEKVRQAFLKDAASESDDGEDEFFKEKKRGFSEVANEEPLDVEVRKKMEEFFGEDDNIDENELFLKNFFANKMWMDKGKSEGNLDEDDLLLDEVELEKQDKYEAEYNFRYEEGAGDRVLGHSRFVEGSVRKKNNARKEQRKKKEERMAQAEFERNEELKHLKNLKKKDIKEKLEKIREIAGIGEDRDCNLGELDLEEEFDPEEYDKKMKQMFGDDYYDAEDADPGFGSDEDDLVKPDFDKEDELLGLPKDWGVLGSGDGFMEARERNLKCKEERKETEEEKKELEDVVVEEEVEEARHESKRKKKRKMSLKEKLQFDKELEEYYKLDYEDTIGDIKTRFKYKMVKPRKYGLKTEEILMLDDKQLNQYVSLKKIAPYSLVEWQVPRMRRKHMKDLIHGEGTGQYQRNMKHKCHAADNSETHSEEPDAKLPTKNQPSRSSRRRKRQAELKPSISRLIAYGKAKPPKSKSHKKH